MPTPGKPWQSPQQTLNSGPQSRETGAHRLALHAPASGKSHRKERQGASTPQRCRTRGRRGRSDAIEAPCVNHPRLSAARPSVENLKLTRDSIAANPKFCSGGFGRVAGVSKRADRDARWSSPDAKTGAHGWAYALPFLHVGDHHGWALAAELQLEIEAALVCRPWMHCGAPPVKAMSVRGVCWVGRPALSDWRRARVESRTKKNRRPGPSGVSPMPSWWTRRKLHKWVQTARCGAGDPNKSANWLLGGAKADEANLPRCIARCFVGHAKGARRCLNSCSAPC